MDQKSRVIKDFEKLDIQLQEQIKFSYPNGFAGHLIYFTNREGKRVSALPFETDTKYYLVRMTVSEAKQIIEDDDDYNDSGILRSKVKDRYEDRYADLDYLSSDIPNYSINSDPDSDNNQPADSK